VRLDARLQLVQEELSDVTDLTDEIQELSSNLAAQQQTLDDTELSLLFLEQSSTVQSAELTRMGRGLGEVSEQLEVVNQENDVALTTIAEAIRVADESATLIGQLSDQFAEETSKFCKPSDFVKGTGSSVQISSNCLVSLDCGILGLYVSSGRVYYYEPRCYTQDESGLETSVGCVSTFTFEASAPETHYFLKETRTSSGWLPADSATCSYLMCCE
jgi:hypothetical protein